MKPVNFFGTLSTPQLDLVMSASTKFSDGLDNVIVNVTSCEVESPVLKAVAAVVASAAVMVTVGADVSDVTENFDTAAFPLPAASVTFSAVMDVCTVVLYSLIIVRP